MVSLYVSPYRALRADRDRFQRVLEASGLGLWELDLDSGEFHVDARCARVLGYEPGELEPSWETAVALIHPQDAVRVARLFEAHLRGESETLSYETRMLAPGGRWTWVAGRGRTIRGAAGNYVSGTLKNIDAEHAAAERLGEAHRALQDAMELLQFQALHDPLTGLLNRRGFDRELARLPEDGEHALCYLDLDHFKVVNDTCGHAAGDELLRQLPALIEGVLRKRGAIARLGGDEFAVLLANTPLPAAGAIAGELRDAIHGFRFSWRERAFGIGACLGVVAIAGARGTAAALAAADAACYIAKERGGGQVHVSCPNDIALQRRRSELRWVARIKRALEEDRFRLHFMSIAPLAGGPARHHELLLRLAGREGAIIGPDAFLPVAERHQLMPQVDRWVIGRALAFVGRLAREPALRAHCFGINLSGDSLRDTGLLGCVRENLARHRVPPSMVYFEFTETAALASLGAAAEFMGGLRALGCALALDDFGAGMSSFTYLKHLPVDFVKIDGGFIRDLPGSRVDQAIVRAVLNVGAQLGIEAIAEYVESEAIERCLRGMGVHYGQGYAIARPRPLEEFAPYAGAAAALPATSASTCPGRAAAPTAW